jgi:serine/threonine-protein kinase ULK4
MAPELFSEGGVFSYASDLWSFGCILFEFMTGETPYKSSSLSKIIKMI